MESKKGKLAKLVLFLFMIALCVGVMTSCLTTSSSNKGGEKGKQEMVKEEMKDMEQMEEPPVVEE